MSQDLAAYIYSGETYVVEKYLKQVSLLTEASNLKFVDCIYVINLDERAEK